MRPVSLIHFFLQCCLLMRYEKLHIVINRKPIRNNAYPLIVWIIIFLLVRSYVHLNIVAHNNRTVSRVHTD